MNIREIELQEIDFLHDMLYEALFVPEGEPALPRSIINIPEIYKYIKEWGRQYDLAIVAEDENKMVGAVWGRIYKLPDTGYGYVNDDTPEISIAVKSEYRNRGIGTSLINAISKEYAKYNIKAISLSVDKRNRALNLYLNSGFEIYADNRSAWTLRRFL